MEGVDVSSTVAGEIFRTESSWSNLEGYYPSKFDRKDYALKKPPATVDEISAPFIASKTRFIGKPRFNNDLDERESLGQKYCNVLCLGIPSSIYVPSSYIFQKCFIFSIQMYLPIHRSFFPNNKSHVIKVHQPVQLSRSHYLCPWSRPSLVLPSMSLFLFCLLVNPLSWMQHHEFWHVDSENTHFIHSSVTFILALFIKIQFSLKHFFASFLLIRLPSLRCLFVWKKSNKDSFKRIIHKCY